MSHAERRRTMAEAAALLLACVDQNDDRHAHGSTVTGERLAWWFPPAPVRTAYSDGLTALLQCAATLRDSATVSALREGACAVPLPVTASAEHVRMILRNDPVYAHTACGAADVAGVTSRAANRTAVAVALAHIAASLHLRLCIAEFATAADSPASASPSVREAAVSRVQWLCAGTDIACVAHWPDGRWSVLERDDGVRVFANEQTLPLALALAWAAADPTSPPAFDPTHNAAGAAAEGAGTAAHGCVV